MSFSKSCPVMLHRTRHARRGSQLINRMLPVSVIWRLNLAAMISLQRWNWLEGGLLLTARATTR